MQVPAMAVRVHLDIKEAWEGQNGVDSVWGCIEFEVPWGPPRGGISWVVGYIYKSGTLEGD